MYISQTKVFKLKKGHKQVKKRFHRNQKKCRDGSGKQTTHTLSMHFITASTLHCLVTHNHPYISSDLLISYLCRDGYV